MPEPEKQPDRRTVAPNAPDYLYWGVRPVTPVAVPGLLTESNESTEEPPEPPLAVLVLRGAVDVYTAPVLTEAFEKAWATARSLFSESENSDRKPRFAVLIDFTQVAIIDSNGLSILMDCAKRLRESGGRLALFGLHGRPARVISLTGLQKLLPVYTNEIEAAHGGPSLTDLSSLTSNTPVPPPRRS